MYIFDLIRGMYRLSKDILDTVIYYDVLDFPLTAFEVWKHLLTLQEVFHPSSYRDVFSALCVLVQQGVICEESGFYRLPDRLTVVNARIQREKLSVAKLKRVKRLGRLMYFIPYVRFVGATGSLSLKHGDIESDWDMFVVLRSEKIWTGRIILTGILFILGKWRHGNRIRNRACLNYFVTDDSLEVGMHDLFSAHEYRFMIPLFNYPLFQRFELKNRWIATMKPNFSLSEIPPLWMNMDQRPVWIRSMLERWIDFFDIESRLSVWQRSKIARNPKTHWVGSYIETSSRALIFLPRPRGPRVYELFKKRLGSL